jgi:hypothetical protein
MGRSGPRHAELRPALFSLVPAPWMRRSQLLRCPKVDTQRRTSHEFVKNSNFAPEYVGRNPQQISELFLTADY